VRLLSEHAYLLAHSGALPIFMGGDHSLSMGSVNGSPATGRNRAGRCFVLWLDAHADYNTPQTTLTGNMHGMSRRFYAVKADLTICSAIQPRASITPASARSVSACARSIRWEKKLVHERSRRDRRHARARRVRGRRADPAVIEKVKAKNGVLHLSFDVDFLDPAVAPGVGPPFPAAPAIARRI